MGAVINGPFTGVVELDCRHLRSLTVAAGESVPDRVACGECPRPDDSEATYRSVMRSARWVPQTAAFTAAPEDPARRDAYLAAIDDASDAVVAEVHAYLRGMFGDSAWNAVAAYHLIGVIRAEAARPVQAV